MALTESTMLELGVSAPDFALPDVTTGRTVRLANFADDKALLVMFICRHCPFVIHVQSEIASIGRDYADKPLGIIAICANDVTTHPGDAPEHLKAMARELGFSFAYCHDESQAVAKAYTAACTPDFFLFNADRKLAYRGQLDGARPESDVPLTGKDLRTAIDAVLAGEAPAAEQRPSVGCNIKWKAGSEPVY